MKAQGKQMILQSKTVRHALLFILLTSFFGSVELPNLQPSQVTIVNIMLANDIGVTAKYGNELCKVFMRLVSKVKLN